MTDIYEIQGGLSALHRLKSVPDLPMHVRVPESQKDKVDVLDSRRYNIEYVPEKIFYGRDKTLSDEGYYKISLGLSSFSRMVRFLLEPLVEDGVNTKVQIKSRGKIASERATIHNMATSLSIKVSVNIMGETFTVTNIGTSAHRREPNWWTKVKDTQGFPTALKFTGHFHSFRCAVYKWAKRKNRHVSVLKGEQEDIAIVTYHGPRESVKTASERFNGLIDSLPYDEPSDVPEWLSSKSDATIRVMCSNHPEALSYRGGKLIRYAPQTPHRSRSDNTENTGDFVYNGRNYGPRTDKWIEIFMKSRGEK